VGYYNKTYEIGKNPRQKYARVLFFMHNYMDIFDIFNYRPANTKYGSIKIKYRPANTKYGSIKQNYRPANTKYGSIKQNYRTVKKLKTKKKNRLCQQVNFYNYSIPNI